MNVEPPLGFCELLLSSNLEWKLLGPLPVPKAELPVTEAGGKPAGVKELLARGGGPAGVVEGCGWSEFLDLDCSGVDGVLDE